MGDNDTATLPVPDLIAEYPSRKPNITDRPRGDGLHRTAGATRGFGVAPDIRYSGINLSKHQHAAVFRLPDKPTEPAEDYLGATVAPTARRRRERRRWHGDRG